MLKMYYWLFLFICCICMHANTSAIHEHGYWIGSSIVHEHVFDHQLAETLADFFIKEKAFNIADFGCGMGFYVETFQKKQINCTGYDGNPNTPTLTKGFGQVLDLSQPVNLNQKFDWIVSLEVGEHIPKIYEENFLKNLHNHNTKGIILSWAIKGQGGFGHVNCQDNKYIKKIMAEYGYYNDIGTEKKFRFFSTLPWFKNSIMVFRKQQTK